PRRLKRWYPTSLHDRSQMRVALHQPNFLPHAGFFLKWMAADHLLLFDTAQVPDRGFTQRTKVLLGGQESWLSLPVIGKRRAIREVSLASDQPWRRKLCGSLERVWGESNADQESLALLCDALPDSKSLVEVNLALLKTLAEALAIKVPCSLTSEIEKDINPDVSQRIVDLVKAIGGSTYLSGPSGRGYLDPTCFADAGLALEFFSYELGPYPQASQDFVSGLSIVDTIANLGLEGTKGLLHAATTRISAS
ncbi:MAG: WbqC family protein, partial [Planctomycetes bacterium]|nr:WbqC family protein [Planctomycetota bacterium]